MEEGLLISWVESPANRKTKTHTLFFESLDEGYEFMASKSCVIQVQRIPLVRKNGETGNGK